NQFTDSLESKVAERTEQLQTAQQRLVRSDRLASLGQLAASVAHEINNPINGVLNLSMLMQRILKDDGIPPGRTAEFRKYLSQVASETSRVGRIVSDLLSFSRQSKPQRSHADLNQIVKTTVSLISHKLKLSDVALTLQLDENLPPLECDASQIQQVVLNLMLNGAEASQGKPGRRVEVRTRYDAEARSLVLSVSDNGEGISEANLPKIFDPFFTTKPEGKGVGLGLAVVYGIVEAHGGDVTIATRAGEGTTMNVILPLGPEATRPAPAAGAA
ncbi:MAG TPA: ATP-binding protein, partial [Bryobacteraceae bacterium]|nr:ATP-binding protein [Bryobacteraceae bacterium]